MRLSRSLRSLGRVSNHLLEATGANSFFRFSVVSEHYILHILSMVILPLDIAFWKAVGSDIC